MRVVAEQSIELLRAMRLETNAAREASSNAGRRRSKSAGPTLLGHRADSKSVLGDENGRGVAKAAPAPSVAQAPPVNFPEQSPTPHGHGAMGEERSVLRPRRRPSSGASVGTPAAPSDQASRAQPQPRRASHRQSRTERRLGNASVLVGGGVWLVYIWRQSPPGSWKVLCRLVLQAAILLLCSVAALVSFVAGFLTLTGFVKGSQWLRQTVSSADYRGWCQGIYQRFWCHRQERDAHLLPTDLRRVRWSPSIDSMRSLSSMSLGEEDDTPIEASGAACRTLRSFRSSSSESLEGEGTSPNTAFSAFWSDRASADLEVTVEAPVGPRGTPFGIPAIPL